MSDSLRPRPSPLTLHQAIRDLRTGEIVAISRPLPVEAWPFRISEPEATLWRYGDYWKFRDLFRKGKLYFTRADRLEDKKEGRFTKANRDRQSRLFAPAFADLRLGDPATIRKIQESHRVRTYLNCWHKNHDENPLMWSVYTQSSESIAVRTSTPRLLAAVGERCRAFDVQYIGEDEAIPELHSLALFAYKRRDQFAFEQEFRLVYMLPIDEPVWLDRPEDFGRRLPADPKSFVEELRFHPAASLQFKDQVRRDLQVAGQILPTRDSVAPARG